MKSNIALAIAAILLGGCAAVAPEKRHSPAEIAAYTQANFVSMIASAEGEREAYADVVGKLRAVADVPVPGTEAAAGALWAMAFLNTGNEQGRRIIGGAVDSVGSASPDQQREILSAAYAQFPEEAFSAVERILPILSTPREFAIAAYALLKVDAHAARKTWIDNLMRARFADWQTEGRLRALEHVLATDLAAERRARPPLADLLAAPLRAGVPVIYSLQRNDRRYMGMALVRGADGRFRRNADGGYFSLPHLALSLRNLPGTITNGNTPQGIFTIVGAGTATDKWIGPTPYLESKVPFEATVSEFTHGARVGVESDAWRDETYDALLPPTWRNYFPIKEAYLAGLAGRNEMLLHGTVINASYYRGESYYPGTPSAGCLVASETWHPDGRMRSSDQLTLLKAFTAEGLDRGYLVVVELDDQSAAVTLVDVLADVVRAEKMAMGK